MDRLLIPRIEGRILTGIVVFVITIILLGWVAINEPGRMASFEQTNLARSTERGAELFTSLCTECHGPDARGLTGVAPGLNSPHFFGYDPFQAITGEMQANEDLITGLTAIREGLVAEITGGADAERIAEITDEIVDIDEQLATAQEDLQTLADERDALLVQLEPAIQVGYLPGILDVPPDDNEAINSIITENSERLNMVSWGGSQGNYVTTTLIHGRPGSNMVWPNPMAAWGQQAAGPLRNDEIEDIANYILNFDQGENWTIEDFNGVHQFAKRYTEDIGQVGEPVDTIGNTPDPLQILEIIEAGPLVGDATRGEALYTGIERTEARVQLGCGGCHLGGAAAPATGGTWDRVIEERLTLAQFEGYSAEQYVTESILTPDAFVVPGYSGGVMPQNYGDQIGYQDLADIIEFLKIAEPQ